MPLPGLLVDPAWLEEHLEDSDLRAVDLRESDAYRIDHVPGAAHLELAALGASGDGRDNVLLAPERFGDLLAERGVSDQDRIVAYDDQWGLAAARLAWALHRYGHPRVAVLDGGWDRWLEEGRPTTSSAPSAEEPAATGRFRATPQAEVFADTRWIAERIEAGEVVLVDCRTPAEFEEGHLPGAVCWDWFNAVPTGSWGVSRDPGDLRAEWRELGLDQADEITVYCRSGMRAAHTWLVLRNAGFKRVRLYDGSWQEWSRTMEGEDGD